MLKRRVKGNFNKVLSKTDLILLVDENGRPSGEEDKEKRCARLEAAVASASERVREGGGQ